MLRIVRDYPANCLAAILVAVMVLGHHAAMSVTVEPHNPIADGSDVDISCSTDPTLDLPNWMFLPAASGPADKEARIVYKCGTVINGYRENYSVNSGRPGQCTLTIKRANASVAGTYSCVEEAGLGNRNATRLVVPAANATPSSQQNNIISGGALIRLSSSAMCAALLLKHVLTLLHVFITHQQSAVFCLINA